MPDTELPVHPLINPLTDQDRILLQQVISRIPAIKDLLDRAEECGIVIGDRRDKHEGHHAIAVRMHERFFPDHLPPVGE